MGVAGRRKPLASHIAHGRFQPKRSPSGGQRHQRHARRASAVEKHATQPHYILDSPDCGDARSVTDIYSVLGGYA